MRIGNYAYTKVPEVEIQVDKFNEGTNKIQRAIRLKPEEAAESLNLMLVDDGLWSPRWGTRVYGGAIAGADCIDGFSEYVKTDGTRELIAVGAGKVWVKDGDSWTEITGATFTAGTKAYFKQINNYLFISNGVDPLARYNGTALITYTEIEAPGNVQLTAGTAISAGDYNYYAVVTALNEVGETVGSTEVTTTTNKPREEWVDANEEMVISWDAVTGAKRYQVYYSDETGWEKLLGWSETNSFTDDNTAVVNIWAEVPDDNTTGGPKFSSLELAGNRLWGTKDPDNKHRVHFSGTGPSVGVFSDFYGGGWIDLERGGRTEPQVVVDYRDGQGNAMATVLCATPEGTGSVWQVILTDATVDNVTFTIPAAQKVVGSTGTNAPRSALVAQNDVYFLNKRGVHVLGNEKQFWGILRTNELSVKIRPYIESISQSKIGEACSYFYDDKVFYSVSTNGSYNNRIFYYDRENLAWVVDWSVGVNQFGEFTDSDGKTHFLGASSTDGYIIEFNQNTLGDRGIAFTTRYTSPQFAVDKNWGKFAKLRMLKVRLGDPRGSVSITLSGTGRRSIFTSVASAVISATTAATGLGFDPMGSVLLGTTEGVPTTFAVANTQRHIKLRDRVRDVQLRIETTGLENGYALLGYRITGKLLDISDPSSEKL